MVGCCTVDRRWKFKIDQRAINEFSPQKFVTWDYGSAESKIYSKSRVLDLL
jgi:hypothetical protein